MRDPPGPSESPLLATRERSSRADHFVVLRACHAQGTRAEHLVRVPQTYEMSAEAMSCSEWAPLKLNTANCGPGRGKMQVSFSHVGSGGAKKTSPLSLGTWPTEGPGHEEALRWYMTVQSKLHPLRGKVGPTDERVQQLMLECRQAAKDACALPRTAEVCLLRTSAVGALCSAYPQPILSLPSAYPLILSHPARGDGGGGGDAAAGELGGESARRLAAPGGLRPPMPLQATEEEAQPARSLSSAYPQPTL
jgi:hypothetical protein